MEITLKELKISNTLKQKKEIYQFLPNCLIFLKDIKKIEHKGKYIKTSKLIDLVHTLLLKYYFTKENRFILNSEVLRSKYGAIYNYYINYLLEIGIVEKISNYRVGWVSNQYKLKDKVLKNKISRFINTDISLLKNFNKMVSMGEMEIKNNLIPLDIRIKLINDLEFCKVDIERSVIFLNSIDDTRESFNKNMYAVESIHRGHLFYNFDDYGRFHTNFTVLKSFIRKNCLTIEGEETFEFDINNSQPLFLIKLMSERKDIEVEKVEFELFKFLTINGVLYQYIIDNSNLKNKKQVKELVYRVLFGINNKSKKEEVFFNLFPSVYNFIKKYKGRNYKIMSHRLQNLESDFIFNSVVKTIMNICPEARIITVHDSIITSSRYKECVELVFNQKKSEYFNI